MEWWSIGVMGLWGIGPPILPYSITPSLHAVLLLALAGGLGWGVRGSYGHEKGASLPGAMVALALCFVSGRADWQEAGPFIAAVTAAGIAFGGCMSYGKITGYARSVSCPNAAYGLACLFFIGGLWGGVGGCALGLALGGWSPPALLAVAVGVALTQQIGYFLLIEKTGLRMTPPRSDDWARSFGALLFLTVICLVARDRAGLVGLSFGFLGWGFGFLLGMFFQLLGARSGIRTNWWRVMEITMGATGGAFLALGVLPLARESPELPPIPAAWRVAGAYALLWLIPVFHLRHNVAHWKRHGVSLGAWWDRHSATVVSRTIATALLLPVTALGVAWHAWGPDEPAWLPRVLLLGVSGACVLLCILLDAGIPKGGPSERGARWYALPYLLLVAGSLADWSGAGAAVPWPPDRLWAGGLLVAAGLVLVFAAITTRLWPEDPPGAHRRFGPGADPDVR